MKRRETFFTPDALEDVLITFRASIKPLGLPSTWPCTSSLVCRSLSPPPPAPKTTIDEKGAAHAGARALFSDGRENENPAKKISTHGWVSIGVTQSKPRRLSNTCVSGSGCPIMKTFNFRYARSFNHCGRHLPQRTPQWTMIIFYCDDGE